MILFFIECGLEIILFIRLLFFYKITFTGIYKFGRKYLHPDRVLNNDLVDFLSRVPDNEILVIY